MKKLLLILVLCFLPFICEGKTNWYYAVSGTTGEIADHCASGCTGTDCDVVCVDAETGAAECSFSDTDGGAGSTITWNASHTGAFCCTDKGSYAIEITFGDTETTYSEKDLVSEFNVLHGQFYFLVHSETLADTEVQTLFRAYDPGCDVTSFAIRVLDDSGTLKIQTYLNQTADDTTASTKTITLDTWYMIRFSFDDEDLWTVTFADCNGDNSDTVVNLGAAEVGGSYGVQCLVLGQKIVSVGTTTVQYDNIKVDDDTAIAAECTQ